MTIEVKLKNRRLILYDDFNDHKTLEIKRLSETKNIESEFLSFKKDELDALLFSLKKLQELSP